MIRIFLFALILSLTMPALAAEPGAQNRLPIPRFVSLKSDKVLMRVGPGTDYPIEWVYTKKGLPIEVIAEYDVWRKIRDPQGTEGWISQQRLTGRRMIMTTQDQLPLLRRADAQSNVLAKIESGVVGRLLECDASYCRIEVSGFRGWVKRSGLWGIYPNEQVSD